MFKNARIRLNKRDGTTKNSSPDIHIYVCENYVFQNILGKL